MKKKFTITGMHCVSCECILEEEFSQISGVKKLKISHKTGLIEIESNGEIPMKKIQEILDRRGYQMLATCRGEIESDKIESKNSEKFSIKDFWQILGIFAGFLALFAFFSQWEITKLFPDLSENMNFGIALLLGIVASVSTCLALTGGLVMGFSSLVPNGGSLSQKMRPQIFFHIGRIGGFFILGGILGAVGGKINYSMAFTGYLTIFVAAVMFYIGLNLLNLVPNISRFGFYFPKFFASKIREVSVKKSAFMPFVIGILTFFLPCGFTQSMQLSAVASGDFLTGALIMTFFAIGTLPVLFSVGIGASYAQNRDFGFFKKIVGVLILFFALYSFKSGLILSGSNFSLNFWKPTNSVELKKEEIPPLPKTGEFQTVKMTVDYRFEPTEFRIKKGIPVRWEIDGINISGCTNEVIIPRLGISSGKLKKGLNIIEFTPTESGILPFSCWMGMQGGNFIVE